MDDELFRGRELRNERACAGEKEKIGEKASEIAGESECVCACRSRLPLSLTLLVEDRN